MSQPAIHTSPLPHIKPGVFFAPVAGEGVLLDLAANRYVGLTALSSRLWSSIGAGETYEDLIEIAAHHVATSNVRPERVVQQQLELWEKAGLLIRDEEPAEHELPVAHLEFSRATDAILPDEVARARLSIGRVVRQIWNSIWVRRSLRRFGLSETIRAIQQLPARDSCGTSSTLSAVLRAYLGGAEAVCSGQP